MSTATDNVVLSEDELAFFRLTCDLYPAPESPLRFLEEAAAEPKDPGTAFEVLKKRGLLNPSGSGAAQSLLDRLTPVSECSARVMLAVHGSQPLRRDFYLSGGVGVEYDHTDEAHQFGPVRTESAVVAELAQYFKTAAKQDPLKLRLSPGDYLVFAVFARDLRATEASASESHMSIDEVLAYFDEPESKVAAVPTDDSWTASMESLSKEGVLVRGASGFVLHQSLHQLARQIVADRQHTVTRFDFLDEQWLMREVSLYPTPQSVYRLGTQADGSVVIEELTAATLADVLAGVVGTLPNLLNPEAPATLRNPALMRG